MLLTEAGWKGPDEEEKAASIVAAFKEEWLADDRVESVVPGSSNLFGVCRIVFRPPELRVCVGSCFP